MANVLLCNLPDCRIARAQCWLMRGRRERRLVAWRLEERHPEYKSQTGLRKESPHHPHRQRLIGKFRFNIQSTFYN